MSAFRTGSIRIGVAVLCGGGFLSAASDVVPGDPVERVIEELGQPPNVLTIGPRQIYDYARGRVEIENGVVIRAEVLSEDEAEASRLRLEAAAAAAAEQARVAALHRRNEGRALLARRLDDPAFIASPAADRAMFFRSFAARYPEIPVAHEYRLALREAQQDFARHEAAAAADAESIRAREREQQTLDLLTARLRALELENAVRQSQPPAPAAPTAAVQVNIEIPQVETYLVPTLPAVPRKSPPPPSSTDTWGRYSISRRLPPQGTPTFGGPSPAPK